MAHYRYPTKFGIIHNADSCKDNWKNITTDKSRDYTLRLQAPAMRSFHAAERHLGHHIKLTGSWRSCAAQRALYDSDHDRYAHPDTSLHCDGLAIDVHTGVLNDKIKRALKARGWHQARPEDEAWHFSFRLNA